MPVIMSPHAINKRQDMATSCLSSQIQPTPITSREAKGNQTSAITSLGRPLPPTPRKVVGLTYLAPPSIMAKMAVNIRGHQPDENNKAQSRKPNPPALWPILRET
ncbi:hypothetical protein ES703_124989 [subsurface metagenome]